MLLLALSLSKDLPFLMRDCFVTVTAAPRNDGIKVEPAPLGNPNMIGVRHYFLAPIMAEIPITKKRIFIPQTARSSGIFSLYPADCSTLKRTKYVNEISAPIAKEKAMPPRLGLAAKGMLKSTTMTDVSG